MRRENDFVGLEKVNCTSCHAAFSYSRPNGSPRRSKNFRHTTETATLSCVQRAVHIILCQGHRYRTSSRNHTPQKRSRVKSLRHDEIGPPCVYRRQHQPAIRLYMAECVTASGVARDATDQKKLSRQQHTKLHHSTVVLQPSPRYANIRRPISLPLPFSHSCSCCCPSRVRHADA